MLRLFIQALLMSKKMHFVHCWIKPGGALQVLEALVVKYQKQGFSTGSIYTLYSDRTSLKIDGDTDTIEIPIITSLPHWLNRFFVYVDKHKPWLLHYFFDYRNLMPFFPCLMSMLSRKLDKHLNTQTDELCISSYAVAKNIRVTKNIKKTIYFHQPMHYIRTLHDEYLSYLGGRKKRLFKIITPYLRKRDKKPRQYDTMYANSMSTKRQIQELYFPDQEVDIQVVSPPIDARFFHEQVVTVPDNYFFYINRLTKMFKHLDVLIQVCNILQVNLVVAGDGPDKHALQAIAGPTITFVGWIKDYDTKMTLIKKSKGILNIAHESFGIVTAESLLLGVPVFGSHSGASPELVDTKSGLLIHDLEINNVVSEFQKFIDQDFDRKTIQDNARKMLASGQKFRYSN